MKASFLVVALFGITITALANDGAITGVGGTIQLLDEHPSISLIAEHVSVTVNHRSGAALVECLFVLTNRGEACTVRLGFPETFEGDTGPRPFDFFRSTVNGEPTECARVAEDSDTERPRRFWWIKQVMFEAGETKIVGDTYRAPAGHAIGDRDGNLRFFEYTLATGASWAGPIEAATITFRLEDCDSTWKAARFSSEPNYSTDCEYTWQFQQFEPGGSGPPYINVSWREVPEGD